MTPGAEIADLPATELRRLIAARQISAVEVAQACLERIERYNGIINAVVTLNDRAIDEARTLDHRLSRGEDPGLLWGLPVGIKDVTEVAGLRTTYGSPLYRDFVPEEDALVVKRLRAAGAIIIGKTNCPEFAAGGNTFNEVFGCTRNPWDPSKSAGGSTGGGAAGLATGMMALAQGTDLGGSLRIPASFCGVVGLRPSVGLVPTYPSGYLWDTLQVTGPMARTAADVALMLQAIAGPSPYTPLAQPTEGRDFSAALARGVPGEMKVAYCPDTSGIGIDPAIERICRDASRALEQAGAQVDVIELDLSEGREAFLALRGLWFVTEMYPHLGRLDELGPNVRGNTRSGLETTTQQLAAAEHVRAQIRHRLRECLQRYDYLLTPTMAVPPFPVEQNYPETVGGRKLKTYVDWIAPTFVLSLAGLPVASVPCGLDQNGLPVGLQIVGPPFGEEAVLALARLVEELCPIGRPPLSALHRPALPE